MNKNNVFLNWFILFVVLCLMFLTVFYKINLMIKDHEHRTENRERIIIPPDSERLDWLMDNMVFKQDGGTKTANELYEEHIASATETEKQ